MVGQKWNGADNASLTFGSQFPETAEATSN